MDKVIKSFSLSPDAVKKLDRIAWERHLSMSSFVEKLIMEFDEKKIIKKEVEKK